MKLSIRPCPICCKDHDIEAAHRHELDARRSNPLDTVVALLNAVRAAEEAASRAALGDVG
jgi:hypothetical protein